MTTSIDSQDGADDAGISDLLTALPKIRLVRLLLDGASPATLRANMGNSRSTGRRSSDPFVSLIRLTKDALVSLILKLNLLDRSQAMHEFLEYRFTDRPSLYLRSASSLVGASKLQKDVLFARLGSALQKVNTQLSEAENSPVAKSYKLEPYFQQDSDGLIELRYTVQHRVNLVDTETLMPLIVYTAAGGIVLINGAGTMMLISTSLQTDADNMSTALADAFEVGRVKTVSFTNDLLSRVVDTERIMSNVFQLSAYAEGSGPRSITLSDRELAGKSEYRDLEAGKKYRTTYGYYLAPVAGSGATAYQGVGLTRSSGRVWLPHSLSRTELVEWGRTFMRTAADRQQHYMSSDSTRAVESNSAEIVKALPSRWKRKATKDSILSLLVPLAEMLHHPELETYPLAQPAWVTVANLAQEMVAICLEVDCEHCHKSTQLQCPSPGCNSTLFKVEEASDVLECASCGTLISEDDARGDCECGWQCQVSFERDLVAYPSEAFIGEIASLLRVVDEAWDLSKHAFMIEGDRLRLMRDRLAPQVLKLSDILEFRSASPLEKYPADVRRQVLARLELPNGAKMEKCVGVQVPGEKGPTFPCLSCAPNGHQTRECLRTVVMDRLGNGHIEPHAGTEIADLPFDITVGGQQLKALAFGKHGGKLMRSTTIAGREVIAQVLQWLDRSSYEVICVLSSSDIAHDLRLAIESLARYGNKSVLYLSRDEVASLLAANIAEGTDLGPAA